MGAKQSLAAPPCILREAAHRQQPHDYPRRMISASRARGVGGVHSDGGGVRRGIYANPGCSARACCGYACAYARRNNPAGDCSADGARRNVARFHADADSRP